MSTTVFQVALVLLLGSLIVDHASAAHIGKLDKDGKLKLMQRSADGDAAKQASSKKSQTHHSNSIRLKSDDNVAASKRQNFIIPGAVEYPSAPSQFETNLFDIDNYERPPSSVEDNVISHFLSDIFPDDEEESTSNSNDGSGSGLGQGLA